MLAFTLDSSCQAHLACRQHNRAGKGGDRMAKKKAAKKKKK
jgi:hypothetical protein